jgi:uncharacterized protein (TIGR02118 family)
MIGAISMMQRRPDVAPAEFRRHWLDIHGPLVCQLPGLRRYLQSHVVASPLTSPLAREFGIDGFPQLWFDSVEARAAGYGSPELAACDRDSPDFIGRVARLVTEPRTVVAPPDEPAAAKLILLHLDATKVDDGALAGLPGLHGYVRHQVLDQGPAPRSAVAYLDIARVAVLIELWFDDTAAQAAAAEAVAMPSVATYVVEEHHFTPS